MNLDVTRHPEFPFRHGQGDLLEARAAAFLDALPAGLTEAETLHEFLYLAHSFAFLEKLVQGDVLCELPVHASTILSGRPGDLGDEGERLAEAEEDLLDWTAGSVDRLAEALDTLGVKVFLQAEAEAGTEGVRARADLFGAFCFDAAIGPAILAGAIDGTPEAEFVLAHELGHLVADVDPYLSRFCRWDGPTLRNESARPEEQRADRFARALLMPASKVLRALHDLGPSRGEHDSERLAILATLFGVPEALVPLRLADLGILEPLLRAPPAGGGPPRSATSEGRIPLPLPERYVNLALAAYGGRALNLEMLAQFLRTTEEEAQGIAEWAGVRPEAHSSLETED